MSRSMSCVLGLTFLSVGVLAGPPASPKNPVTDEYHGVKVVDDYRWLEDWNDPKVKAWSEAQNAHARSVLDAIPCAPAVRARVTELENAAHVEYDKLTFAGGLIFAAKHQPPKQQPLVVVLKSADDPGSERVIVDPNTLDPTGGTSFDWFVPSPDGTLVAISLSKGGSESGDVHVFETATGKQRDADTVPRVNGGTAGGSLAWAADSAGFYYTRYPRAGERPPEDMDFWTQLSFHKLGAETTADTFQTGKDYPKIAEIAVEVSPDGKWVLTNVQNGDGGEFIQDLRSPNGTWTRLTKWTDKIVEAKFGHDSAVYLISRNGAPKGKVLRLALGAGTPALADAKEIVRERSDGSVETDFSSRNGLFLTVSRLYVLYQVGGPNELRVFDLAGKPLATVPTLPISSAGQVAPFAGDDVLFANESFINPPGWYRYAASTNAVAKTALVLPNPPKMPELVVTREFAASKDGTKVPVSIIRRKDAAPNAKAPTLVWGYGGYGVNETPTFSTRRLVFVEQGGTFAVANIRGGGEFGEEWHVQGNLTKKQNVFDDFYAAAKHMIDQGYTTKDKLAVMGGSNGGLLMGATFTQHPDLCKAVVSSVGIYDMLRVELSANGAFNVTEFGTVKDPAQFKALHAYSPYHHVTDGTKYPAILFLTGANDPRVDPMQSRKMTARLQAANPAGTVVLRTSGNSGHGIGTPLAERIEQTVDIYSFLFDQLGVKYTSVGGTPEK